MTIDHSQTPIDLNRLDEDECEWWTQFAEERTNDDGTRYIGNPNEDLVYLELVSRAREIKCSQWANLINDEIIPGPFAAELILDFIPLYPDILNQLELLQIGMSTVHEWPDTNFDGFQTEFLNLMWKTIELVEEKVKDSTHADEILHHFLDSDSFWNEPIVFTSIVALKKPSPETLGRIFSKFGSIWNFDTKALREDNDLDLMEYELRGVAPLLAVCVLTPNASLKDIYKILEITKWTEDSEFGLYFWEYVCALVSRGEGSSFWCPNTFWRDGFFENGLFHHQTFIDRSLEFTCLKFYLDNRSSLNFFKNAYGEQVTERHVVELLTEHPGADEETKIQAKLIQSTYDDN